MRHYFVNGNTRPYAFRKEQLKKLKQAILHNELELHEALRKDLNKSPEESWVTETGLVIAELNAMLAGLKQLMQPEKVGTNLLNMPSSSFVMREPLGVVLIIGPWNYPLQLLFTPLIGAIAAGNCAVLKASEYAPATASIMRKIIETSFSCEYVLFTDEDGTSIIPQMMNSFTFDHVFYTGSTSVGRIIYQMAATRLVPVTLELGGKSPCIVEDDASIAVTANRIAIAKFSNCGQMCVAPDYILVHASKKDALVVGLKKAIENFFTASPESSYNYGRIINERQFNRIVSYLKDGNILSGGAYNQHDLYIQPTLVDNVSLDSNLMRDEIFGPILPLITFNTASEARDIISRNPNPLAFYVYTSSSAKEKEWLESVAFGGGCVNNCSWHLTNHHLPFGGRGFSGTGVYHGKDSFNTFSHKKAVMKTPTWFDPAIKYPPFKGKLGLFKMIIR